MAISGVLVDSGPLVALLNQRDHYHSHCLSAAKSLHGLFYTSWPAVAEAGYLLKERPNHVASLLDRVRSGTLQNLQLAPSDVDGITRILDRFADQGFDLADATLMHLAEREGIEQVFTIDQRHFSVFRTSDGRAPTLHPAALT